MLVMLSCGGPSAKIISIISKQLDNVDIHYLSNVHEFINQSNLRHFAFDRLVFSPKFISAEEDMSLLCDYIRENLSSVEVVMILQTKGNEELKDLFLKYFDSPMYTVMFVDSPTTKCVVDAVKLPIPDIKARYCASGIDGSDGDSKKSKIGSFRGGKRNKQEKEMNGNSNVESVQSAEIVDTVVQNQNVDVDIVNTIDSGENGDRIVENVSSSSGDLEKNVGVSLDSSVSHDDENLNVKNADTLNDELDLTIGDYGSAHSDSGFVGDDDVDELKEYAKSKENKSESNNSIEVENNVDSDVSPISNEGEVANPNRVNIVLGLLGSGATAFIVDTAVKASRENKKVLIIDLDVKSNGILSFINTSDFYAKGCNKGIDNKKVYTDDNIDILSNGYGVGITTSVNVLLKGSLLLRYDLVLVDCPFDSLSLIDDDIFMSCNVILCCITDVSKLLETSLSLYDRGSISLIKEKYISNNCEVVNKNISIDDVNYVKSVALFPNGCWLDNL